MTARIATVQPGYCDVCEHPFAGGEDVHEFVFASRGGSFVAQYATCAQCHKMREPGAVSALPVRVQVSGAPRFNLRDSTYERNSAEMRCTPDMAEFFARSVIEVHFSEDVAA